MFGSYRNFHYIVLFAKPRSIWVVGHCFVYCSAERAKKRKNLKDAAGKIKDGCEGLRDQKMRPEVGTVEKTDESGCAGGNTFDALTGHAKGVTSQQVALIQAWRPFFRMEGQVVQVKTVMVWNDKTEMLAQHSILKDCTEAEDLDGVVVSHRKM